VKASRSVSRVDLSGLRAFATRAKRIERKLIVYLGPRRQRLDDIEAVPLEEFLSELPAS
jgi:hypothetical protein